MAEKGRVEASLIHLLDGHDDLTDIVGENIYPIRLPEKAEIPGVSIIRVSSDWDQTHDQGREGLVTARFQFDSYAREFGNAVLINANVKECLLGSHGTVEDVRIDAILHAGEDWSWEEAVEAYRVRLDLFVHYLEE